MASEEKSTEGIKVELLPWQKKFLTAEANTVIGVLGRGAGKSFAMSILVVLYLLEHKNVICCAQRYDSLKDVLYREIKNRVREWGLTERITFKENPVRAICDGQYIAYGVSYDSVDAARGLTECSAILADEVALAPADLFTTLSPCLRGPGVKQPRIYACTTPRKGSIWNVRFSEAKKLGWQLITGSTYDNTFLSEESIKLIEDSIPDKSMRDQELNGIVLDEGASSAIISLKEFMPRAAVCNDDQCVLGLDCADGVDRDSTALFLRKGNEVLYMHKNAHWKADDTAMRIMELHRMHHIDKVYADKAFSDLVIDRIKYNIPCEQISFGSAAERNDLYANRRAEMFGNLAKCVRDGMCVEGHELTGELKRQMCAISWIKNNQDRLLVTPKDQLRLVLGTSTDIADAAALACIGFIRVDNRHIAEDSGLGKEYREALEEIMADE